MGRIIRTLAGGHLTEQSYLHRHLSEFCTQAESPALKVPPPTSARVQITSADLGPGETLELKLEPQSRRGARGLRVVPDWVPGTAPLFAGYRDMRGRCWWWWWWFWFWLGVGLSAVGGGGNDFGLGVGFGGGAAGGGGGWGPR